MILKWLWLGKFLQTVKDAKSTEAFPASPRRREMALHLHFPFYDVQVGNFFWKSYHFHFPSIVSLVAVIYCIVIIYLPSLVEADTNFVVNLHLSFLITIEDFFDKCLFLQGPKRCTTTVIERNITNAFQVKSSGDSSYQGSSQPHLTPRVTHSAPGPLAQSGVSVRWRKMILIQFSSNSTLIPAWDDDLQQDVRDGQRPGSLSQSGTGGFDTYLEKIFGKKWKNIWKKMKMLSIVSVRSWGRRRLHVPHLLQRGGSWALQLQEVAIRDLCEWEAANFIIQRKRFEFPPQDPGDIETCHQFSNLISCKVAWESTWDIFWINSENNWRSMFDRWDFAKTYRRSGSATTKTGIHMDWPEIGKS